MHKHLWIAGIILSVIFVSFSIATWGALEHQDQVVIITGSITGLLSLVTGFLLQYEAGRKSLQELLLPSSSSSLHREKLVILAVMGVSAITGIGFVVSALLPRSRRVIGGTPRLTASPFPTASPPTPSSNSISYIFDDNSQVHDWKPSDSNIKESSVEWDAASGHSAKGSLKISTSLWGDDNPSRPQPQESPDAYTHTEIVRYFNSSYNFSGKKASCWVYVPTSMATPSVYVSMFVKSSRGSSGYSNQDGPKANINDNLGMWFQLSLTIGHPGPDDYVDSSTFDSGNVAALGVLIKAAPGSTFTGKNIQFSIDDCTIS